MPILNIFLIIGIIALIFSFSLGKNAIWGGATLGLIIGLIIGIITQNFSNILRTALIGADIGLFFELLSFVIKIISKKNI